MKSVSRLLNLRPNIGKVRVHMDNENKKTVLTNNVSILLVCFSVSILLSSLVYLSYYLINTNKGTIVIPAGTTYLGPPQLKPDWTNFNAPTPAPTEAPQHVFTADKNIPWKTWKAKTFPYQFSYPETLLLTGFPNDPMDSVGISWNGLKPQENILINVIDLTSNKDFESYVNKPKKEFVLSWWKQFSGLTGATPIVEFTNNKGLKGYKTRFINQAGQTPNLDIFFEVPKNPNLMIRIANGIVDPAVFDAIVDSVSWGTKE